MGKCCWPGRKERAGRKAGPLLGSFLTALENPPTQKVMGREFLFGGSQACSSIIRETSRLCIDGVRLWQTSAFLTKLEDCTRLLKLTKSVATTYTEQNFQRMWRSILRPFVRKNRQTRTAVRAKK